jgi:hypothetical protein
MADWKKVTQEEFDQHIENLEAYVGSSCHSRYFKRDDIIVYYFGQGNALDQQWVAKVHLNPKSYHIADLP